MNYLQHFSTLTSEDVARYKREAERLADKVKKAEENGAIAIAEARTQTQSKPKPAPHNTKQKPKQSWYQSVWVRLIAIREQLIDTMGETPHLFADIATEANAEGLRTMDGEPFDETIVTELLR